MEAWLGQRVWLQSGRDQLLGPPSSLFACHLLHAQQRFGSAGYNGHREGDLQYRLAYTRKHKTDLWGDLGLPASSRSG
jgi:hypothetical protein